jgi:hypothetical protein
LISQIYESQLQEEARRRMLHEITAAEVVNKEKMLRITFGLRIIRPHQELAKKLINLVALPPPEANLLDAAKIECDFCLGALLRHYYREAA